MVAAGYKETEIGVIPSEWEVVKLGSLGITYAGLSGKTKEDFGSGSPFITYMNVFSNNSIDTDLVEYVNINSNEKQNKVQNGDIFFTVSSETKDEVGMTSVLLEDIEEDTYINSFCFGFRLTNEERLLPVFAKFLLREHNTRKRITFYGAGTTRINISKVKLMDLLLQLPPLKEQEKIADILSTADDKIDAIAVQIEKAKTLKKGLLQKLLSEGIGHSEFKDSELGKIPESWEVVPFLELADKNVNHSFTGGPFGSDLKSEHYTNEGVRVIQLQNIGDGSFINNDFVYTSEEKAKALKTCQIYPNDIILAKMAEPVARACIMPDIEEKYLMGSDGIRLHIDKSKYDTNFIFQSINHNRFRDIAIARSTGTTRLRIGLTALKKIPIAIPPLEEQQQIAKILSTADDKLEVLKAKKEKYETLKKGLLQKLLSGEVRV